MKSLISNIYIDTSYIYHSLFFKVFKGVKHLNIDLSFNTSLITIRASSYSYFPIFSYFFPIFLNHSYLFLFWGENSYFFLFFLTSKCKKFFYLNKLQRKTLI